MLAESFLRSGKVRDLHRLNDGRLLLLASDRISAFDVILPTAIADKGRVLTGLSRFWFAETAGIVPNHLLDTAPEVLTETIATDLMAAGHEPPDFGPIDALRGRMMICRPAKVVPIEAVVRGYLAGSGWKEYRERGTVCGIPLPGGLREGDRLPEPIFTPATKAELGEHDENIDFDGMVEHIGGWWLGGDVAAAGALAEAIRDRSLRLYGFGAAVAERRGILLADTKFEFGLAEAWGPLGPNERGGSYTFHDDQVVDSLEDLILIDEVLTPDSSRFWDAATYAPGGPQASFDKQFVRDWLETQPWDKTAPGPALPDEVVAGTRARYVEAYERITGASFERYLWEDVIGP
jgi:phosphoribosylaminoimidazole-succinocarboxamide synthase